MSLETVGQLVAQHAGKPTETQEKLTKAELEQALLRKMVTCLKWGSIIIGLGVFLLVVNKTLTISTYINLLSAFLMLSGLAVAGAGLFDAMMKGASLSGAKSTKQVAGGTDAKSLPTNPNLAELPSVTERTTQLIGVEEAKTNKMMDTKGRQ